LVDLHRLSRFRLCEVPELLNFSVVLLDIEVDSLDVVVNVDECGIFGLLSILPSADTSMAFNVHENLLPDCLQDLLVFLDL
jgi:hypothetical protein